MVKKGIHRPNGSETDPAYRSIQKRPFRPNPFLDKSEISSIKCMQEDIFSGKRHLKKDEEDSLIRKVRQLDRKGGYKPKRHQPMPKNAFTTASNNIIDILCQNHIGIIVSISSRVMRTKNYLSSELGDRSQLLLDLIQVGRLSLEDCVRWRFDLSKGFRLTTYASHRIRHDVKRYIEDNGTVIRKPVHVHEAGSKISQAMVRFQVSNGRRPTIEELSHECGMKVGKLRNAMQSRTKFLSTYENVDGEKEDILSLVPSGTKSPENDTGISIDYEKVNAAFAHLRPIEMEVLKWRFGLERRQEATLQEIADRYNLSRERIRQLERNALRKLRARLEIEPRRRLRKDNIAKEREAEKSFMPPVVAATGTNSEVIPLKPFMPSSFIPKDFEEKKDLYAALIRTTRSLSMREKLVLEYMNGLDGYGKMPPAQIARTLKISMGSVLAIAKRSFEKLDSLINPSSSPESQTGNG